MVKKPQSIHKTTHISHSCIFGSDLLQVSLSCKFDISSVFLSHLLIGFFRNSNKWKFLLKQYTNLSKHANATFYFQICPVYLKFWSKIQHLILVMSVLFKNLQNKCLCKNFRERNSAAYIKTSNILCMS